MTQPDACEQNQIKTIIPCAVALFLLAMLFPMMTDEAYYIDWARRTPWPAFGFFDHPPMVSWIASLTRLAHDIKAARLVVGFINFLSLYFTWKTAKILLGDRANASVVMLATSFGGIAGSILLTPDTGMIACWNAAIYFALRALRENPKWWIAAGAVAGLGLWSKYTMILIGPAFIWGMWTDHRKQLFSKWPWMGAAAMFLIFAPHVWWQSQNDWVTFRFQFGHGFSLKPSVTNSSLLPEAREPKDKDGPEYSLVKNLMIALSSSKALEDMTPKPSRDKTKTERRLTYIGDFIGGTLGLWGLFPLLAGWTYLRSRKQARSESVSEPLSNSGLIKASAFFPLLFFGLISPFSKIEANWPAMHMSAMSILMIANINMPFKSIKIAAWIHLGIAASLIASALAPSVFHDNRGNRLMREVKGYAELSDFLSERFQTKPLAVDSYQLKSEIAYYAPNIPVTQWPGITRGSEYTRGAEDDNAVAKSLLAMDEFSIVSMTPSPRLIPDFQARKIEGARVCPDGGISVFSVFKPDISCDKGVREWWITTYSRDQKPR